MSTKKKIPHDFRAVALDETKYYRIDPKDKRWIKSIYGVYIYDKNEYVHVASLTPSYWLEPVYTVIDFKTYPDDENIRERLNDKYENESMEGTYMNVHDIDVYVKKHPDLTKRYGKTGEAEDLDEVREYWQSNYPL